MSENLKAAIEAFLFVSEKPLLVEQIKGVFEDVSGARIREILLELKSDYENTDRGLHIVEVAGGFQMVTALAAAEALKKFFKQRDARSLSRSALETLAIVAYKQPVTRLDIESLRGVNVDAMMRSLLEKNLIRTTGRKEVPGRPFVYGTTRQFLEYFGLASLEELPKIEDFAKKLEPESKPLSLSNRTEAFIVDSGKPHEASAQGASFAIADNQEGHPNEPG